MTSRDGREWSRQAPLAHVEQGHYQISNRRGDRVATAFNYHPRIGGLNARTNLYYVETDDMGATWRTAGGDVVATPLTESRNAALVHDYEAEQRLVYLKDLNFDDERPAGDSLPHESRPRAGAEIGPTRMDTLPIGQVRHGRSARSRPATTITIMDH